MTDWTPSLMGRKGGKASGPRKARTTAQARKAAKERWKKARKDIAKRNNK